MDNFSNHVHLAICDEKLHKRLMEMLKVALNTFAFTTSGKVVEQQHEIIVKQITRILTDFGYHKD